MLNMSDFDEAYAQHPTLKKEAEINCKPPACFVGSYAPVSKAGEEGSFFCKHIPSSTQSQNGSGGNCSRPE